jgi:hypothetical protein
MREMPFLLYIVCERVGVRDVHKRLLLIQRNMFGRVQDRHIPLPVIMSDQQPDRHDYVRKLSVTVLCGDMSNLLFWFEFDKALFEGLSEKLLPFGDYQKVRTVY